MRRTFISAASLVVTAFFVAALAGSGVARAAPAKQEPKKPPHVTWVCEKDAKPPAGWASNPVCSAPGALKQPCDKSYCKLVPKKS